MKDFKLICEISAFSFLGLLTIALQAQADSSPLATQTFSGPITIRSNKSLTVGNAALVMQPDGNLVLYQGSAALWSSGTGNHSECADGACYALFQQDGNLVLYRGSAAYWNTATWGHSGARLTVMTKAPYLQIAGSDGSIVWTGLNRFDSLTLYPNQKLTVGQASDGMSLIMQGDGNLVLYKGSSALWSSGTGGQCTASDSCVAAFQTDGNLVIYKGSTAIWNSGTGGHSGLQLSFSSASPYISILEASDPIWSGCPAELGSRIDCATGALKAPAIARTSRLGVAHVSSKYYPFGNWGSSILSQGAQDAYNLGFRTLKIWLDDELQNSNYYGYDVTASIPGGLSNPKYMSLAAQEPQFAAAFSLPFQTFFLETDNFPPGLDRRVTVLSESDKKYIYQGAYALAYHLLKTYKGTNKIFILQNHEGDNHTSAVPGARNLTNNIVPSSVAQSNYQTFWSIRQQAISDARRALMASDVYVYQMCEVNTVVPSWNSKTQAKGYSPVTLASQVIPNVNCDLVGYSSYESSLPNSDYDSTMNAQSAMQSSLAYLHRQAKPSFAFGSNNVVISEIGAPENSWDANATSKAVSDIETSIQVAYSSDVPWVLLWQLYDNECKDGSGTVGCEPRGFWVRKPDQSFGKIFSDIRSKYLSY